MPLPPPPPSLSSGGPPPPSLPNDEVSDFSDEDDVSASNLPPPPMSNSSLPPPPIASLSSGPPPRPVLNMPPPPMSSSGLPPPPMSSNAPPPTLAVSRPPQPMSTSSLPPPPMSSNAPPPPMSSVSTPLSMPPPPITSSGPPMAVLSTNPPPSMAQTHGGPPPPVSSQPPRAPRPSMSKPTACTNCQRALSGAGKFCVGCGTPNSNPNVQTNKMKTQLCTCGRVLEGAGVFCVFCGQSNMDPHHHHHETKTNMMQNAPPTTTSSTSMHGFTPMSVPEKKRYNPTTKHHSRQSIVSFDVQKFAEKHVKRQKTGGLFSKTSSLEATMTFSKELKSPLLGKLSLDEGNEALQMFRNILSFMGDRSSGKVGWKHVQKILTTAIKHKVLREEVFLQLIKQTTKNPHLESRKKGYQLFVIACSIISPSHSFAHYLSVHIEKMRDNPDGKEWAQFARQQFTETLKYGTRRVAPSEQEILRLMKQENTFDMKIRLLDGGSVTVPVETHSSVNEVSLLVGSHLKLPAQDLVSVNKQLVFGLYECKYDIAHTKPHFDPQDRDEPRLIVDINVGARLAFVALDGDAAVMDSVSRWDQLMEDDKKVSKMKTTYMLTFRPLLHFERIYTSITSPATVSVYYHSAADELVNGSFDLTEKAAGKMGALQLLCDYGNDEASARMALENGLPLYLSSRFTYMWREKNKKLTKRGNYLVDALLRLRSEEQKQHSNYDEQAWMRLYLQRVLEIPQFGTTQVRCAYTAKVHPDLWDLKENEPIGGNKKANEMKWVSNVDVGINEKGVFLMDPKEKKVIAQHDLNSISRSNYRTSYEFFYYCVGKPKTPEERVHIFQVRGQRGRMLHKLIEVYKARPGFRMSF